MTLYALPEAAVSAISQSIGENADRLLRSRGSLLGVRNTDLLSIRMSSCVSAHARHGLHAAGRGETRPPPP